jgi:hypothetical protein
MTARGHAKEKRRPSVPDEIPTPNFGTHHSRVAMELTKVFENI